MGFPAIFAAILLLNVWRMCKNENYIILMTFHEQKNCLLPFLALIKKNFCLIRLTKKCKYFWIFSLFKANSLSYQPLYAWNIYINIPYFTIAQWENVLVVDGQQFAQIADYFTFWKNLFLSISPSKHYCFEICKKCHAIPQFASINQTFTSVLSSKYVGANVGCPNSDCALGRYWFNI